MYFTDSELVPWGKGEKETYWVCCKDIETYNLHSCWSR